MNAEHPTTWHRKNRAYLRDYLRDYRRQRKEAVNRYSRTVLRKVFATTGKEPQE